MPYNSSNYVYSTTGNSPTSIPKVGGVAIGITDATSTAVGQPLTVAKTLKDMVSRPAKNRPVQSTGNAVTIAIPALASTGSFAYEMTDWIVARLGTTINGVASNVLTSMGTKVPARRNRRQKAWGAKTSSSFRAGRLRFYSSTTSRTPWTATPSGNTADFVSTTNNAVAADDEAIYVTFMAVPGELVYRNGSKNPYQDNYKAQTGN